MDVSEAKRLRALEEENRTLKKLLAEAMLDQAALKELLGKKWRARRQARGCRPSQGGVGDELSAGPAPSSPPTARPSGIARGGRRTRHCARGCETSPTSAAGSATAGCSSCFAGKASHRASTASTGSIARRDWCASAKADCKAPGMRAPTLVEARPSARWSLDFVHDQLVMADAFASSTLSTM